MVQLYHKMMRFKEFDGTYEYRTTSSKEIEFYIELCPKEHYLQWIELWRENAIKMTREDIRREFWDLSDDEIEEALYPIAC